MTAKPYDTVEGIAKYLTNLEGLNRLIDDRFQAGYKRRERLNDFVILGRWTTDSCGNFSRITGKNIPKEMVPGLPDVLPQEELWNHLPADTSIESTLGIPAPPVSIRCAHCGKYWSLADCHDFHDTCVTEVTDLRRFVGQTLGEVKAIFARRRAAQYFIQPGGSSIRNDRFIDLRPDPKYPDTKINTLGWVGEREGIGDGYIIQPGDEALFNARRYYHGKCNRLYREQTERQYFSEILRAAGYGDTKLEAIPNGYCPCEYCAPWFKFKTHLGEITIGWRKRVINIDWSDTRQDLHLLFCSEDVTKDNFHIHAWGKEKAIDYLMRIWLVFFRRDAPVK